MLIDIISPYSHNLIAAALPRFTCFVTLDRARRGVQHLVGPVCVVDFIDSPAVIGRKWVNAAGICAYLLCRLRK